MAGRGSEEAEVMQPDQIGAPAEGAVPPPAGIDPCGRHHGERVELADVAILRDLRAPRAARAVVARCLVDHVASTVLDNLQLLVTELVSNSVLHSGAPEGDDVVVRIHLWQDACRLEVEDQGCDGVIAPQLRT